MKARAWAAALVVAAVSATGACTEGGGGGGARDDTAATTSTTAAPYTAADARFRASFPGRPQRTESDVPASGQTFRLVQYAVQPDGATAFAVGWFQLQSPLPAERIGPFLEGAMNGSISSVKATLVESARVDHDGHPAIEYLADAGENRFLRARTVLHTNGKDAYFVQVTSEGDAEARYRAFVDSVELLPA